MTIPAELVPLHAALREVRDQLDAYVVDIGALRTRVSRVMDATAKAAREARNVPGAAEIASRFEAMSAGLGGPQIVDIHDAAVGLAGQMAKIFRDFEIAAREK